MHTVKNCSCCHHPLDIQTQEGCNLTRNGRTLTLPGLTMLTCWNLDCSLFSLTFTSASYPADPAAYLAANDVKGVVALARERTINPGKN
mgnify:CR=1 FL=1